MRDDLGRRKFLIGGAVLGTATLSGCGDAEDPAESNDTTADTTDPGGAAADESEVNLDVTLADGAIDESETAEVTLTANNIGSESTDVTVTVEVGDDFRIDDSFTVDADETTEREYEPSPPPGVHTLTVDDEEYATLVVHADPPDTDRTVGAHYYPWYGAPGHDFRDGEWSLESPSTPVLGNYTSSDRGVIDQHIDWCHEAGISWLNVAWWGEGSVEDRRFREDLLEHPRASELEWSVLYETEGQFARTPVDMDDDYNREQLREDLVYLAETFFSHESYKRIDDRPVLYIWIGGSFQGDVVSAYEEAVEAAGVRPYLIVDLPESDTIDQFPIAEVADAVNTYNPWDDRPDIDEVFLERLTENYDRWHASIDHLGLDLIPGVIPGFDDTEITHTQRDNEPLEPTPSLYRDGAKIAAQYADGPVLVTSFNEWYEDTQIEPSEEHGEAYLEITAEVLATGNPDPPTTDESYLTFSFERAVPESDLASDVENGRELTMLVSELRVHDTDGELVVDADVGSDPDEITFLLGAFSPGSSDDDTWRWFGGDTRSLILTPELPAGGELELVGRAATDMEMTVSVDGTEAGTTDVSTEYGSYTVPFEQ